MAQPFDSGRTKRIQASNVALVLIILAALGIRAILFVSLEPWDTDVVERRVLVGDARSYHYLATSIVDTGAFDKFDSGFYLRTPGYPLFIAGVYIFSGPRPWIVILLQIIIDSLTVLVVYGIAKELGFKRRTGLIASALYAASLIPAVCAVRLMSETLFTFLFALSMMWFIRGLKHGGTRWFLYCGLTLGAATMVRPVTLSFVFAYLAMLAFSKTRTRKKALGALVIFLTFFAVLAPWQARNYSIFGRYALSNLAGTNLCRCNIAMTKAFAEGISLVDARAELEGTAFAGVTDPFERSDIYSRIAAGYIRDNFLLFAKYHTLGCAQIFMTTARGGILNTIGRTPEVNHGTPMRAGYMPWAGDRFRQAREEFFLAPVLAIGQTIVYFSAILGLFLMFREGKRRLALLLIIAIAYFTLIPGVFCLCRFRIPAIPLYVAAAAYGMSYLLDTTRRRIHRRAPS